MDRKQFTDLLVALHEKEIETNRTKGKEYAGDEDVLSNFKELSKELDLTPEKVLWVYLKKHLSAIRTYCNLGDLYSTEDLASRILDARLYLALLLAMQTEKTENQKLEQGTEG